MFEQLLPSWWNCLARVRRCGHWIGLGLEISKDSHHSQNALCLLLWLLPFRSLLCRYDFNPVQW